MSIEKIKVKLTAVLVEYKELEARYDLVVTQLAEKTREVAVLENTIVLLEHDITQLKQEATTSPPPAGQKYP